MTRGGKARISFSAPVFARPRHWRADTRMLYRRCTTLFRSDYYRSPRDSWTWYAGDGLTSSGPYPARTPLVLQQVVLDSVLLNLSQGDRQSVSVLQVADFTLGAHPDAFWIALVPNTAVPRSASCALLCGKRGG